jgi:hypothetical protein
MEKADGNEQCQECDERGFHVSMGFSTNAGSGPDDREKRDFLASRRGSEYEVAGAEAGSEIPVGKLD